MTRKPQKPVVIVVEDNTDAAEILGCLLESQYDVRLFDNGQEALEELRRIGRPVVMYTDYHLKPGPDGKNMTGLELIDEARTIHPGIPVIMVTGSSTVFEEQTRAAGAVFLQKPVLPVKKLLEEIGNMQARLDSGAKGPLEHAQKKSSPKGRGG